MSEVNKETLQNSMGAKYKISLPPVTHTFKDNFTEIHVHRTAEDVKKVNISSGIGEEKRLPVEIDITEHSNIPVTIGIPYYNCMTAQYRFEEPDKLIAHIPSDMDSYTNQQPPFHIDNYGHISSMHVKGGEYERHSLIYFHLPLWFLSVVSISTKLRLYYRGGFTDNEQLTLHTVESVWYEYGVTAANEPYINHTIGSEFIRNKEEGYIEFDVTNLINLWKQFPERNEGFVVTSEVDKLLKFFTRETEFKPLLVAEYYDPMIKSFDRVNKNVEIDIRQPGESDIEVTIEPETEFGELDKDVTIMPYTKGDIINEPRDVELIVTNPIRPVEITVARLGESEKEVIIQPMLESLDIANAEIRVSKPTSEVEITAGIGGMSEVPVEIEPQVVDDDIEVIIQPHFVDSLDKEVNISVFRDETDVELTVGERSQVEVELTTTEASDIPTEIKVSRPQSEAEIYVLHNSDKEVDIHAKGWGHSATPVDISVTRPQTPVELDVIYFDDIEVDISAKGWAYDENNVDLSVKRDNIYVEFFTKAILDDKDVVIYVSDNSDIETVIEILERSNIEVELTSTEANDKEAIITVPILDDSDISVDLKVSRDEIGAQIGVYFHEVSSPLVEIQPLVRRTNNQMVEITVPGMIVGYAFIM